MAIREPLIHVIRLYARRPPLVGGMEAHISALSCEQRKLGVTVTDVYNRGDGGANGIQVMRHLVLHRVRPTVLRDGLLYMAAGWRLRSLRNNSHLVIHAHGHWSAALMARLLAKWLKAEAVALTVHGRIRSVRKWLWQLGLGRNTGQQIRVA